MNPKLLAVYVCALCMGVAPRCQALEVQTFDSPASAAAGGWAGQNVSTGGNNFGFQATNLANGLSGAGEGGGQFQRPGNIGYYSDLTLEGTFGVFDALTATGRIYLQASTSPQTDNTVSFGFWNQLNTTVTSGGGPAGRDHFIGVTIRTDRLVTANAFGGDYGGYNGSGGNAGASMAQNLPAGAYDFSLIYTPGGFPLGMGQFNYGELTATFTPVGGGPAITLRNALNPIQNRTMRELNAFGIVHVNATADVNNPLTVLFDDLAYSSNFVAPNPAPEPSSLLLATLLGAILARQRKMRQSIML